MELAASKRAVALQLEKLMQSQRLSKSAMAGRMHTSRAALDRLLDAANPSVTLVTLDKAARRLLWAYGPEKGDITILAIEPHPEDQKRGIYQ